MYSFLSHLVYHGCQWIGQTCLQWYHSESWKIRVIYDSWVPKQLHIQGILLYPYILISCEEKDTKTYIIKHEMIHVDQIRNIGMIRFYISYLLSMLRSILIHRSFEYIFHENDYEREAYQLENCRLNRCEIEETEWKGPSYGPRPPYL